MHAVHQLTPLPNQRSQHCHNHSKDHTTTIPSQSKVHQIHIKPSNSNHRHNNGPKNHPALPKRRPPLHPHQHHLLHPTPLLSPPIHPVTIQTPRRHPLHPYHAVNNLPRARRRPTLGHRNNLIHHLLRPNIPRAPSAKGRPCDPARGHI